MSAHAAACTIQRAFRCFLSRNVYFVEVGIAQAASTLQQAWRCHASRAEYFLRLGLMEEDELLKLRDTSPPAKLRSQPETEQPHDRIRASREFVAALVLQCSFRCFAARNTYYELLASPSQSLKENSSLNRSSSSLLADDPPLPSATSALEGEPAGDEAEAE